MSRRRKYDLAKFNAENESKLEQNDSRPWFLVSLLPPPDRREVLVIWADGKTTHAWTIDGKWWLDRDGRTAPPVAWKPTFNLAPDSAYTKREKLPDPFVHGYSLTR